MVIRYEKYILSSQEGNCYHFTANKYRLVDEYAYTLHTHTTAPKPVTLALAHAVGLHKELWEPFLEDLKLLQVKSACFRENGVVTEAWSVDCPSHGDAAILNEKRLIFDDTFHSELNLPSLPLHVLDALFLWATLEGLALLMRECVRRWGISGAPFHSLVIIECPVVATPLSSLQERSDHWMALGGMLSKFANKRRDKWTSVKDAHEWFRRRSPYRDWDSRALRRYLELGLRPLPTAFYPNETTGYTLKCHRSFESRPFGGRDETTTAGAVLEELHPFLPVHIIFGQLSPFRPPDDDIPLLTAQRGKNSFYAFVTDIPGANHLVRLHSRHHILVPRLPSGLHSLVL
ncbi:hypothetical protein A7U60_g919 [Sanghuangporus baumii]|uniref:Uncharacterized protein n=1 Tax=Sanghuangporus baumii TaxID=108892 RepID=A0A9Q5I5C0_SANBA|nr:hypothetical protein A7U60_g919 [Sanghuangporus baumii]